MDLKLDKNGNVDGFVKKEHHDKTISNLNFKINSLEHELETIQTSYSNLDNNHNVFLKEYKKKCEDYNKVLLKLERKNVSKELMEELDDYKKKVNLYIERYGVIIIDKD